jgi:excisionase family DNA binding protein
MNPLKSYTPSEVSKMLGVKPSTVYAWLSRKELSANKVGHNRFITNQQLKEFHEQRNHFDYVDKSYVS